MGVKAYKTCGCGIKPPVWSSCKMLTWGYGFQTLECEQSYERVDMGRITNMILSKGDKVTGLSIAIKGKSPLSTLDALCERARDHDGPTPNIGGKGWHGPKSNTIFITSKNLG
jgi:hypothetical protein